ncbi:MAG: hypothetical protein ACLQHK_07975 [Gallionellaceae bacterium]
MFAVPGITTEWIERLKADPEGRDRLEAFVGKFSRMQDPLIDKLLPNYLAAVGKNPALSLITSIAQNGWACLPIRINGLPCASCATAWCMNMLKTGQSLLPP